MIIYSFYTVLNPDSSTKTFKAFMKTRYFSDLFVFSAIYTDAIF